MKRLHRPDLFSWSVFDTARNIDFHGILWTREGGNVLIDPMPMSAHDQAHLEELGSASIIVITNSDHARDASAIATRTGAVIVGPAGEKDGFPIACERWLSDGDEVVPGLRVFALAGSKTPGELALLLEDTTLITGDLVRAHEGGRLCTLPAGKLSDALLASASIARLADLENVEAVLPGDGWPVFSNGSKALQDLAESLDGS